MGQMRMRFGVHAELEAIADQLIAEAIRKGGNSHASKADILTPSKEQHRRRREIYVPSGTPDPALRVGVFGRAANKALPHLNSRDGVSPPMRYHTQTEDRSAARSSLADFVNQHLGLE